MVKQDKAKPSTGTSGTDDEELVRVLEETATNKVLEKLEEP